MAVIQEQPQLQAYVECDGEHLPEFDADDNDANATTTTTKYIKSKSGAEFAVQFELHRPFPQYAMTVKLYIDGKRIDSRIIDDIQYPVAQTSLRQTFDNVKIKIAEGQSIMQKFCFSELQIEDLEDHDLGAIFTKNLQSLGTIKLKAFYIQHLPTSPLQRLSQGIRTPYIGSRRTSSNYTTYDYVHPQRSPFDTFVFKYRSRTAFQSLLIIPRNTSSNSLRVRDDDSVKPKMKEVSVKIVEESGVKYEHSATVTGGDDDVIFVTATKHRQLKEESGLKREHSDDGDQVAFVSATKRRRSNRIVNKNGVEVIDLT